MRPIARTFPILLVFFSLLSVRPAQPLGAQPSVPLWPDEWVADGALLGVWARTDAPVASRAATRSWVWGPVPFAVANEAYAESPTGRRLTLYLDKARMEINDPLADRASQWFVSSGLLVGEMVEGRVQVGNLAFEAAQPAGVLVAGDPGSPNAPLYSSFSRHTAPMPRATGARVTQRISRDGALSPIQPDIPANLIEPTRNAQYDEVTGHNVPTIFANWVRGQGLVLQSGRLVQGQVIDPLYVLGRPITEAYWAEVLVRGAPTRVLVQLYERRALTFNPQNPPEWQVEMANVGRAYYDWRYGSNPPGPALAAEPLSDGVRVRGWNWSPGQPVSVQFDLAGSVQPLAGPQSALVDASGRFSLKMPVTPQMAGAILARANVQVRASTGEVAAALPYGSGLALGQVKLEGEIVGVSLAQGSVNAVALRGRDGKDWTLNMGSTARLQFNEGSSATAMHVAPGAWSSVEGSASGGSVNLSTLRLLSASHTGAKIGWTWQGGGKTLGVVGRGWPPGKEVNLAVRTLGGSSGKPFAVGRADSRGILNFGAPAPHFDPAQAGTQWIFASASDKGVILAQAALPYDLPAGAPPSLILMSGGGEQKGGLGSYCWEKRCADAVGAPLPALPLVAAPGEVMGLRSQFGPDPDIGVTPLRFTARLYTYADGLTQGVTIGGVVYFAPASQPLHAVDVPGRPFSITLPANLAAGRYALVISATWANSSGVGEASAYGFTLLLGP